MNELKCPSCGVSLQLDEELKVLAAVAPVSTELPDSAAVASAPVEPVKAVEEKVDQPDDVQS